MIINASTLKNIKLNKGYIAKIIIPTNIFLKVLLISRVKKQVIIGDIPIISKIILIIVKSKAIEPLIKT